MISMFMQGGPSHVDLFDRKDELIKHHMQEYSGGDFKFDSVDQASRSSTPRSGNSNATGNAVWR